MGVYHFPKKDGAYTINFMIRSLLVIVLSLWEIGEERYEQMLQTFSTVCTNDVFFFRKLLFQLLSNLTKTTGILVEYMDPKTLKFLFAKVTTFLLCDWLIS